MTDNLPDLSDEFQENHRELMMTALETVADFATRDNVDDATARDLIVHTLLAYHDALEKAIVDELGPEFLQ